MFFQWHGEILADTLRGCLSMRSPDGFFSSIHRWRARRGDKQAWNDAANDCAVKIFVLSQVGQHWISTTAAHCQLNGTLAQSLLKLVKIKVEQPRESPMMTMDSGFTRRRPDVQRSSLSLSVGP